MKKFILSLAALMLFTVSAIAQSQDNVITVKSPYVDPEMNVSVIVPAQYYDTENAATRYPVVYLLNGYSGNYRSWPDQTKAPLDSLASAYGMIFVCPDGRNSWYWDSPLNPKLQMESFITKTLVPYIDNNYRTIPDAAHRAVTGLSMGGHGGLWLGMRHSDIFGNAGSTSGGVDIRPFPKNWEMENSIGAYDENKEVWDNHTVINLVPSLKPGQLNIIFDCGVDDFFFPVNEALHKALLDAKIPHDYISRPGAHTHPYWNNAILFQIQFFNQQFNK